MGSKDERFNVIISDQAGDMFIQHIKFLSQASTEAAIRLKEKIIIAVKSLESFPERNPWVVDIYLPSNKYRKMLVERRYLLIYQIRGQSVLIDYILDCRQEYRWLL